MGRFGDADVHQAFVEFRAKDSDKCLSAQCIYCQTVKAKNTSRQRQHLLECPNFLNTMREQQPNNPLLELASNPGAQTPNQPKSVTKKRDHTSMMNGTPTAQMSTAQMVTPLGAPQTLPMTPAGPSAPTGVSMGSSNSLVVFPSMGTGFKGNSLGNSSYTVPVPKMERDFQMSIQLNPKIEVGQTVMGDRAWISFISGHFNGQWGKGSVVPGGHLKLLTAGDLSTKIESNFMLQVQENPPVFVTVKLQGWRVGPRDVLEKLQDPAQADSLDPKSYSMRLYVSMESGDSRYLHLNTGMWIGSAVWKGHEMVWDAYRVS